ncbi:TonB-dependent receptor domain-containing protein [Arcticibacterium luteifluviistationis]|uniref:Iron(III) dicitrate transport protein FecA n=1 Tax=Arcticibacterium luteifluviistationis TaxID=1784714 RepID=A0A2Z4G9K2_9BACT|nr:TonB-dependent receptor [Arcticibacterium luteifluviistationis]AWV97760.1 iron(III) dicitrate transport protein FecA [Arcticibacterium luteifluviistationis]
MRHLLFLLFLPVFVFGQNVDLRGTVTEASSGKPLSDVIVSISGQTEIAFTSKEGVFVFKDLPFGEYQLNFNLLGKISSNLNVLYNASSEKIAVKLEDSSLDLEAVTVNAKAENDFGRTHLKSIQGTSIYESKKSEVVLLEDISANLSTNNARQVYAKITGLNIWESDGAGLQLGIGGRGLSPNRTANFNTRQNGYDISADALGYPESYYTPATEALQKIEIIRGASSLQYGTQFGGMLNFVFKKGPKDKKIELTSRQTLGSWNFFGSFNSIGGTVGKLNYYTFYQHKQGDGWRPNGGFSQDNIYVDLTYNFTENFSAEFNHTFSNYTAQQPGGLTDALFDQDARQSFRDRNWFDVDWNLTSLTFDWKVNDRVRLNSRTFKLDAGRSSVGNLERINVADLGGNRTLIAGKFDNIGNETRLLTRYKLGKEYGAFVFGTRYYRGVTTSIQGDGSDGSDADFSFVNPENPENSNFRFPNTNFSVFMENIFNISPKLSITPGVRFEYINTKSEGYYRQRVFDFAGNLISDVKTEDDLSRKRSFVILGLGASFRQSDDLEVYANVSQNYRAINFTDLRIVNPNFSVDPDLQDEKGFTADLGLRGKKSTYFSYDLSLFYIAYKGRIGQILKADQPPLYLDYRLRTNVADARNIGLEAFLEYDVLKALNPSSSKSLSVYVNGAVIDAKYINTEEASIKGKKVEMVPPVMVRTGITYRDNAFSSSIQFSHVGEHFTDATNAIRTATAVEGIIPAYQVVDFSAAYSWKVLRLEGSINNLLNQMYFTRRAEAYPGPGIIPSDGRGFYMTLGVKI